MAHMLDIPYYVMNFRDEFQEKVIDYFVKEYRRAERRIRVLLVTAM